MVSRTDIDAVTLRVPARDDAYYGLTDRRNVLDTFELEVTLQMQKRRGPTRRDDPSTHLRSTLPPSMLWLPSSPALVATIVGAPAFPLPLSGEEDGSWSSPGPSRSEEVDGTGTGSPGRTTVVIAGLPFFPVSVPSQRW